MNTPVSIIIPTYNRAPFLEKAIDSVLNQSYAHFELIVVDDGSTDETPELISQYGKPITYISQQNKGPAAARNRGIKAASHDFIAFLDSDDWFAKDKIALQLGAMEDYPDYLVSHTQEVWYRRGEILNQKKKHRKDKGDIFTRCLELCAVGMSTIMARRTLFDTIGLFDEDLPCCEDYDLWLRTSIHLPFLLVDHPLTFKRGGREDQVSVQYRVGMDRFRIHSILKVLKSDTLNPDQENLARAELIRKCLIYGQGCLKHGRLEEGERYLKIANEYTSDY